MLAACAITDVRSQRIPNALVAGGACAGIALAAMPAGIGVDSSLAGAAAGFALFLPLYVLKGLGAGDVKLLAAVGAFTGWPGILPTAMFALIAGGLLSLAGALAMRRLPAVLGNIRTGIYLSFAKVAARRLPTAADFPLSAQRMPYALAIAAGTAAHLLVKGLA